MAHQSIFPKAAATATAAAAATAAATAFTLSPSATICKSNEEVTKVKTATGVAGTKCIVNGVKKGVTEVHTGGHFDNGNIAIISAMLGSKSYSSYPSYQTPLAAFASHPSLRNYALCESPLTQPQPLGGEQADPSTPYKPVDPTEPNVANDPTVVISSDGKRMEMGGMWGSGREDDVLVSGTEALNLDDGIEGTLDNAHGFDSNINLEYQVINKCA